MGKKQSRVEIVSEELAQQKSPVEIVGGGNRQDKSAIKIDFFNRAKPGECNREGNASCNMEEGKCLSFLRYCKCLPKVVANCHSLKAHKEA